MSELLRAAISAVNLPYTILLGLIVLYWISVIIGFFDLDLFDFDLDTDVDADVDVDVDVDAGGLGGIGIAVLKFFHVGQMPITILISFFALSTWVISVLANYYTSNSNFLFSLLFFVPNVIISLFVTKFCTLPFRALFVKLNKEGEDTEEVVGRMCVVTSSRVDSKFGQAEIRTAAAPLQLNVRTLGDEVLEKGEEVPVVQEDPGRNFYIVSRLGGP